MHPIEIAEHGLVEREIRYGRGQVADLRSKSPVIKGRLFRKRPIRYVRKKLKKAIRKQIRKVRKMLLPRILSPSI